MFWCGCILIFILPIICSSKEFYVINNLPSPNLTCYRDNQQFQPCGNLDILLSQLFYQNFSRIYLLDRKLQISQNIHLNFSSHYKVEIMPRRNNSFSTLVCNSDFTMTFSGIKEIIIQSIQFKQCGKSNPIILMDTQECLVMFVQVINVTFIQSGQSSLQITSDVQELQVIEVTFIGGRNDVDINISGTVLKALFRRAVFSHNDVGSLIAHGSLNESSLDIQNCTFSNNVVSDFSIKLYSLHSIAIESSNFEENCANDFIQVEHVINMTVVDSCFHSNVVQNGLIVHLGCGYSPIASFFSFHNSFVINNTATFSDGGILFVIDLQTFIRNSVFQGNVVTGSGSALTISGSSLTVINMTIFKENEASLGGAVAGKSIRYFYVYRSNFSANSAESGGALLSIEGIAIVIQNSYFNSNIAKEHGGALQIHNNIINISESHYFNNTALEGDGGAINITSDNLHVASSNFSSNSAGSGGALSINKKYQGPVFFNNTIFERNCAKRGDGGAMATTLTKFIELLTNDSKFIKNSEAVNFTVGFSTFNENSAVVGGAISSTDIVIIMKHSNFSSNKAVINGGALLLNTKSIIIKKCIFQDNFADQLYTGEGGAIYFSGTFLSISHSWFYRNGAKHGGGLSIVNNNLTKIRSSTFIHNEAYIGGAINIISGNMLELLSCNFDANKVTGYGAAIKASSLLTFTTFETNFTANWNGAIMIQKTCIMILWNSFFYNNTADKLGGAVRMIKESSKLIYIANCVFSNNSAETSGAILFETYEDYYSANPFSCIEFSDRVDAIIGEVNTALRHKNISNISLLKDKLNTFNLTIIANCTFSYNNATDWSRSGGAILVQGRHSDEVSLFKNSVYYQLVIINSTLVGNSAITGGGISCYSSRVFVKNTLFHDNTAKNNGGGVSLELSEICFSGNVSFIANKVTSRQGKGGALYSNDRRKDCEKDLCPLLWTSQSSLSFVDNVAREGPAIFGGMLNHCNRFPESLEASLKRLEFDNLPYNRSSYAITSSGVKFCYDDSCKIHKVNRTISPGQSFTVNVACLDQMGLPLNDCEVKSDGYESTKFQLGRGETKITINGYEQLSFHLFSCNINSTSLTIYSEILCSDSIQNKVEVSVDVKPCPKGFYLEHMECKCDSRLKTAFDNIECNIENESIFTGSGWLSFKDNSIRMNSECPFNYCPKQRTFILPLQPDVQCANNRGGVLCGGCLANYSVVLGSWKCMECSHPSSYNFIWLTVVMALAGVVLVVFLLLVKMTVSSGTINGLIFYANIVSFSGLLDHHKCVIHPFLHVFISWINLDLGIEVCFYSGMDVYQKTWLQFAFPFYIWFLVGVIILVCHYSSTVMKLMGMRNIEVLATLFLLSYAKLLKTIVTTLSVTNIMVASADNITDPLRPHKVWVYDGNIDYFGSKHLPLFIVAVLFLFTLFMPYTLFLLCGQWLQYMPRKRGFRWIHSIFISTIMDAYHAPYTKHHRYWTGLGLLVRCCLFTIFGTSYSTRINLTSVSIAVTLFLVIRIASGGKLYKNKAVGLLELFYFSNLGILATVLFVDDTLCDAITVSISLSFIVLVGVLFYHLHQETKRSNFYKLIKRKFNKLVITSETKCGISENEGEKVISEQENTTIYFELRESLIDST